jgi:Raf kinase inhibitor-like YbhB/YbcL family protein
MTAFKLGVSGLAEGASIPRQFTCDGEDFSPAIQWEGEPAGTKSFALVVDDPDAPGGTWTHWMLWDIPADVHSLDEGAELHSLGKSGTNDFRRLGYGGPCPPGGKGPHRYFFHLYALDAESLKVTAGAKRAAFEKALRGHVLAEAEFMGRYERG